MTPLPAPPIPASLIIVSRHRPEALRRAVTAVRQLDYPALELVIVADPAGCAAVAGQPAKIVPFDTPNISAARNLGLQVAAGEVVLFLDDDAVPEPTWAARLLAPFADARVIAATGFVRGRNGFSFQWLASEVDALAQDHPLAVPEGVSLHAGRPGRAVKTQGTNCAFRRDMLLAAGGFDPALHFYLDEADVNLRLVGQGLTAVVADAQVHHGFAASARRRADRVPLTLQEIAASTAVFLRRHAPGAAAAGLARLRGEQRARLLRLMVEGRIEPGEVRRLLAGLEAGWRDGMARALPDLVPLSRVDRTFQPLPLTVRPHQVLAGRVWQAGRLARVARQAVADGAVVTLFRFSPTALRHRHRFHPDGYWEQVGGIFGAADRAEPAFALRTFAACLGKESARWAKLRLSGPEVGGSA
ncbi:Glycosyltransferase like family 2 [Gemmobacter aquatilis]|uniref:Glycosyltransferase like family 2 n=1 Tax=Gemmobacter aquatilis TaxID=933059 RepID=A0A1H7ZRX6_9RHOB|nr:glycosyltransferase [Gemmobacter aquatilis]SEM61026.1 Glycosyltransferase like family 2 [Gemmobacter aquatilis]